MNAVPSVGSLITSATLLLTMILTHIFYVKSVQPEKLTRQLGERGYPRAAVYRTLAGIAMTVHTAAMIAYRLYPLPLPIPEAFAWGWAISIIIGLVMGLPLGYLMYRGVKDAGRETMVPDKSHTMYGGIYEKIRHPQTVGEAPLFLVVGLLLNSPFLVVFSLLWLPLFVRWTIVEERDLLIRFGPPYEDYQHRVGMFWPRKHK